MESGEAWTGYTRHLLHRGRPAPAVLGRMGGDPPHKSRGKAGDKQTIHLYERKPE